MSKKTPIVLAAFGTTSAAMDTYSSIDGAVRSAFPDHPVRWAYTSRMVRSHMNAKRRANMKPPARVLGDLAGQGHAWAVVQSMHLISGHEFYRLVEEVQESDARISMGLPLLTEPADYRDCAAALLHGHCHGNGTATVLVGHGTDHPAWTAYAALEKILGAGTSNAFVATIEGESEMTETVDAVIRSGARSVRLVPLMLVAGVHVAEDIAGEEDSWKAAFEAAGLTVAVHGKGLGKHPAIVDIFIRHIGDALAVIP